MFFRQHNRSIVLPKMKKALTQFSRKLEVGRAVLSAPGHAIENVSDGWQVQRAVRTPRPTRLRI
jgi:hypothetical protein